MDFLRLLESIRVPVVTEFMSLLTYCGSEVFFMAVAITMFWCVSKRDGYYILIVGFLGTTFNQFLKLWFRIPRPWVLDPDFTVVESARAGAGGYSFPSGHTQTIVSTMTCIILVRREKWVRVIAVLLMLLVPFSRMYLGCHTPLDVGVAFVMAMLLAIVMYSAMKGDRRNMPVLLLVSFVIALLYWAFVTFYQFPADIDAHNLYDGTKNAYTLFGCLIGLLVAKELDDRCLRFPVHAVWWAQVIKVVLGFALLMVLRIGLKIPLQLILPELPAGAVRYFLMVLFAGAVWPITFPWFSRLGRSGLSE